MWSGSFLPTRIQSGKLSPSLCHPDRSAAERRDLQFPSALNVMLGLERESRHKLQLTHPGKGTTEDVGYLSIASAIDARVGWVSQIRMVECILCLHLKLHR
jgi:hypothetical protein